MPVDHYRAADREPYKLTGCGIRIELQERRDDFRHDDAAASRVELHPRRAIRRSHANVGGECEALGVANDAERHLCRVGDAPYQALRAFDDQLILRQLEGDRVTGEEVQPAWPLIAARTVIRWSPNGY